MESLFTGAYGNVRALYTDLLKKSEIDALNQASKEHFISVLGTTNYKNELNLLFSRYKQPEVVDIVINTHFINNCNKAMMLQPLFGKEILFSYLSKIDLQNIKLIISAKMTGKSLELTENGLSINRGFELSILSPIMKREDYINIINQKSVSDIISYLTRYKYRSLFLQYSQNDSFSSISRKIDEYYYRNLLESVRFLNGTEGPIFRFIRGLIDIRNIITAMKRIENNINNYNEDFIAGNINPDALQKATKIDELLNYVPFKLDDALKKYKEDGLLSDFERSMKAQLNNYYLGVFRQNVNSIGFLLSFILSAEMERDLIREMWFRKYYGEDIPVYGI